MIKLIKNKRLIHTINASSALEGWLASENSDASQPKRSIISIKHPMFLTSVCAAIERKYGILFTPIATEGFEENCFNILRWLAIKNDFQMEVS